MFSKLAIEQYLTRKLDDHSWIKEVPYEELLKSIREILPGFDPHLGPNVKLFKHQLASLYLGLCLKQFLFFLDMGLGKDQPLDAKILTPEGYKTMGQMELGTKICHPTESISEVVGIFPQGEQDVYQVVFSDGTSTECGKNHLWSVMKLYTDHDDGPQVKPLHEIQQDYINSHGMAVYAVPITNPVHFVSDVKLETPPYTFGKSLCTKTNPAIPQEYQLSGIKDRIALLHGLMDGRGLVTHYGETQFIATTKRLAKDVIGLIQSLGGIARAVPIAYNNVTRFCVILTMPAYIPPFSRSPYQKEYDKHKKHPLLRLITSIKYIGKKQTQCIKIDKPDGLYITDHCIVTHNTILALTLAQCFFKQSQIKNALIIVPNVVNIENWLQEIEMHTQFTAIGLGGTKVQRSKAIQNKADLYIINYDGLKVFMSEFKQVKSRKTGTIKNKRVVDLFAARAFAQQFDLIVLDECHHTKNSSSLNYKLCAILSDQIKYRFGLTGTPIGRRANGFWGQFYIIDHGETLGVHEALYTQALFKQKMTRAGFAELYLPKRNEGVLRKILCNRSIRYADFECDDVPQITTITVHLTLQEEVRRYANKLIKDTIDNQQLGDTVKKENIYSKTRQMCSGFVYERTDKDRVVIRFKNNQKLLELESILNDIPDQSKLVIFHFFQESGRQIIQLLQELKLSFVIIGGLSKDNVEAYRKFRTDSTVQILVLNMASGGEGLNLQVANYAVVYEPIDHPDTDRQAIKRIARTGQTKHCFIYRFVTKKSVEERIMEFLKEGKHLFNAVLEGKFSLTHLMD